MMGEGSSSSMEPVGEGVSAAMGNRETQGYEHWGRRVVDANYFREFEYWKEEKHEDEEKAKKEKGKKQPEQGQ